MQWLVASPPVPKGMHARLLSGLRPVLGRPFTDEDRTQKPITVNNRVFRVQVDRRITFLDVIRNSLTHRRKEVKFPQIRVSFGHTESNEVAAVMTYTKGKFVVCGTRSVPTAVRAIQLFRLLMQQCGIAIGLVNVTSVNAVVNAFMPFAIDIEAAVDSGELPSVARHEGDFPGAVFRIRGVEVLAFANGRCVFTGAPDVVEMELVRSMGTEMLRRFAVDVPQPHKASSNSDAPKSILKRSTSSHSSEPSKPEANKHETAANRRRRQRREASRVTEAPVGEARSTGRTKGVAFQIHDSLVLRPGDGPKRAGTAIKKPVLKRVAIEPIMLNITELRDLMGE